MKKVILGLVLAVAVAMQGLALEPSAPPLVSPLPEQGQTAKLSAHILGQYHYKPVPLDNALSEKIFERYLKALDPDKVYFTQADIDYFAEARSKLDDAILEGDLKLPFAIFNRYQQRVMERVTQARELLKPGFDFQQKEVYRYERDKAPWPASEDEVQDLWRKRVKNDWLRLKLAGKDDKDIRATLDKRYDNFLARALKNKSEDAFAAFMNAYAMSIEPHTNYLGLRETEDFDISMRLSLVGIGAILQERDEYITIRELVPGGPAALSGKLSVGDRILGVAQGENAAVTDVLGWRVNDAVKLIRGAKNSTVLLDVLPADAGPDGQRKSVALVRDKVSMDHDAAKKSVISLDAGGKPRRVGVITLPAFYEDFEGRARGDKDFRSASRDVANLIVELKKEKVDALLVDLRNNGGGSLNEAIELSGLFIDKGPVVQERDSEGKVKVARDENAGVAWDGPMAVLINRGSASASEIFAAAMQDYGRAVIVGEPSFGKGTVQRMIDLDQVTGNDKPKLGEIKMTVSQFFRVNGGTTQLRGVIPDISFPSAADLENEGESRYDNALAWMQIKPADYTPTGNVGALVPALEQRYQARVAKDPDFQFLAEDLAEARRIRELKALSLNEAERRSERDALEARIKQRSKAGDPAAATLRDDGLQANERSRSAELAAEKAFKEAKDVLINEAARIAVDEADLLAGKLKVAGQALR